MSIERKLRTLPLRLRSLLRRDRAEAELEKYPLEKLVEVHVSGLDRQPDGVWDNHASRAPAALYRLLEQTMGSARPKAITLEYNWSARFPRSIVREEIARVREVCGVRA